MWRIALRRSSSVVSLGVGVAAGRPSTRLAIGEERPTGPRMHGGIATRAPIRVPAGATPEGDGILLGSGPVAVDVYIDFQSPACKRFEEHTADRLRRLLRDGAIGLV